MGGWWMMGFRAWLGFLVAVVTAHIVEWQYRKYGSKLLMPLAMPSTLPLVEDADEPEEKRSAWQRLEQHLRDGLARFHRHHGVPHPRRRCLAAFTRQVVTQEMIADLSRNHAVLAIGLMMLLAVLLCLCSEADAFVAASFVTLRPSAKLAFLVLGPMLDLKLYMMYTRVFRPRLIYTIFLSVIVQVFVWSYVTHCSGSIYGPEIYDWSPCRSWWPQ